MPQRREIRWSELKVGLVALASVILLAITIFLITGQTGFFAETMALRTYTPDAGGLKSGGVVRLAGVDVGNVRSVGLSGRPNLEEAERRAREALRFVELEQTFDLYPSQLSGGMRRRVAIARAVVGQPELMLYDSPTAGLDPITAARIMTLIVKQRDVGRVSSLLVTHRVQDAIQMARSYYDARQEKLLPAGQDGARRDTHTRFLVLREGESVFHGSLEELAAQRDPYLQELLA